MKYKLLLSGENTAAIDDFFFQMQETFMVLTTSLRKVDVETHLELFQPDAFVYCINAESVKDFNRVYMLKENLIRNKVPLVVIGPEEECKVFEKIAINTAAFILMKPSSVSVIAEKISEFIERKKANEEAYRKQQEEIKKQQEEQEALRKQQEEQEQEELSKQQEEEANRRKHILVVDDDPRMLRLVNEQLNEHYDVATAISGKLAIKFLERKHTDLILLDYEMPVDNGPAVLKQLRDNPETKDIPVIFLTGMTEKSKIQEVLVMKPQGYLLKPIDSETLFKVIKDVLNNKK